MPSNTTIILRDNSWLDTRLSYLWDNYYNDVERVFPINVAFGPRARFRYGSIYSVGKQCHIILNRLFAHPSVPEYVIDATIAHELAHYVHGYGSGRPKIYSHPHRGGVVDLEMERRGCSHLETAASAWRRGNWQAFYASQTPDVTMRRQEREKRESTAWEMYLSTPGFRTEETLRERAEALATQFGFADPPVEVAWLRASARRSGLSYYFNSESTIRLHGTLADSSVPAEVVDYELSYWLAVISAGSRWNQIEAAMKNAGVWPRCQKAIRWRRTAWPTYYVHNHPLKAK